LNDIDEFVNCGEKNVKREKAVLVGHVSYYVFDKKNGLEFFRRFHNTIMLKGKDSILNYLGNLSGGGYFYQIGAGDNDTAVTSTQEDLQASVNKLWKTIASSNRIYVRPTLTINVTFDFSEANYTWKEFGLRDSQSSTVMVARQIDTSPFFTKTSTKAAVVQWEVSM